MNFETVEMPVADKRINAGDSANRIVAIFRGLQQDSENREAEFQSRLENAVAEARATTRKEVTHSLLNRFDLELSKLQTNFDRRLREVVQETEVLAQAKLESALMEAKDAAAAAAQLRSEREQLVECVANLERVADAARSAQTEKPDEQKELERKLGETLQVKMQLQLDLQRAVAELNTRAESDTKGEADHGAHGEVAAIVQSEMVRVQSHLEEIGKKLADESLDMGSEIRLNRERAELQAYLKGLRYSLGEVSLQTSLVEEATAR